MQPRLIFKNPIFHLFHELEKMREVQIEQHSKPSEPLCQFGKNVEVQPKTKTLKIPTLNRWMNWEKLYPDLSFLLKIR